MERRKSKHERLIPSAELLERSNLGVLVNASEMAALLKLPRARGRRMVLDWAREDSIPSHRVNARVVLFEPAEVQKHFANGRLIRSKNGAEELVDASAVAERLGLSRRVILRLAREGRIPSHRVNARVVRFDRAEIERTLKKDF